MIDHFALLQVPRRPWLDPETLKDQFIRLSAELHPDRAHHLHSNQERRAASEQYASLNLAYTTLKEPKTRIYHLLALERGSPPQDVQQCSPQLMTSYMKLAGLCKEADEFLRRRNTITSPILKAQTYPESLLLLEKLQSAIETIQTEQTSLLDPLPKLNPFWETAPPPQDPRRIAALPLDRLETIYRSLSYLSRWNSQLQERSLQLSF